MKLYTYWRSSAAYRVRIALALKGLSYQSHFIHLIKDGGEQLKPDYEAINPQHLVPSLELKDGKVLTQSMAILEFLEEAYPEPALLPEGNHDRAYVRAVCQSIISDIHPVDNLRVLSYLTGEFGIDSEQKLNWYKHWITLGFEALEKTLSQSGFMGPYCHGCMPTFADICLVPQVYNARRFNMDLTPYPNIKQIDKTCQKLDGFVVALPEKQKDAAI